MPLVIKVDNAQMECYYGTCEQADVELQIASDVMNEIIQGRMTFQRAFMAGSMKMRGDFNFSHATLCLRPKFAGYGKAW